MLLIEPKKRNNISFKLSGNQNNFLINTELFINQKYGMCFLDHEQFVRDRVKHLNNILKHTDKVVVHDADRIDTFAFLEKPHTIEMFKEFKPHTAVIRNA